MKNTGVSVTLKNPWFLEKLERPDLSKQETWGNWGFMTHLLNRRPSRIWIRTVLSWSVEFLDIHMYSYNRTCLSFFYYISLLYCLKLLHGYPSYIIYFIRSPTVGPVVPVSLFILFESKMLCSFSSCSLFSLYLIFLKFFKSVVYVSLLFYLHGSIL